MTKRIASSFQQFWNAGLTIHGDPLSRKHLSRDTVPCRQSAGKRTVMDDPITAGGAALLEHRRLTAQQAAKAHRLFPAPAIGRRHIPAVFCLLYTSPSPRDVEESRMPSSA